MTETTIGVATPESLLDETNTEGSLVTLQVLNKTFLTQHHLTHKYE